MTSFIAHKRLALDLFISLVISSGCMLWFLPPVFLPDEDQSRMFVSVRMPAGASLERTLEIMKQVENHFLEEEKENVENLLTVTGRSFNVTGQNTGTIFIKLKDIDERKLPAKKLDAIKKRCAKKFANLSQGRVIVFSPPPVPELGNASGYDFMLVDRGGLGHEKLVDAKNMLLAKGAKKREIGNLRPAGLNDVELYGLNFDYGKAGYFGIDAEEINTDMAGYWGSMYINDFFDRGRSKKVYMQADTPFRMQPDDLGKYFARNSSGGMVSFSEFMQGGFTMASPA